MIVFTIIIGFGTAFFKFRPDQTRAITEGKMAEAQLIAAAKVAAAAAIAEAKLAEDKETGDRFREFRSEVHGLKNEIAVLVARQAKSDLKQLELEKLLNHALSTSSMRRGQMDSMISLIELLIAELARIDPKSIIVPQAKLLLKQIREASVNNSDGNWKSAALNTAEHAVRDAKQTVQTTGAAVDAIKSAEGSGE